MKLTIFGATGKTGRLILEQALSLGHDVTAIARDPSKVTRSPRLRVLHGAADQPAAIDSAVREGDAVISAMGGGNGTLAVFGENVLAAMRRAGVSRIVSLVGASVPEPDDPKSLGRSMLHLITRLLASSALEDGEKHARLLEGSDLAYTLVRPPRLTDGPATGSVSHGLDLRVSPMSSISRADLAAFMLRVVLDDLYVRAAPMVAHSS